MNTRLSAAHDSGISTVLELKPYRHIETLIKHVLPAAQRMVLALSLIHI